MKNLYIDFDGVILDTITPVYNLAKKLNIDVKTQTKEVGLLYSKIDWETLIEESEELSNSINSIKELNSELENIISFTLPIENSIRNLVIIRKIGDNKEKYPRSFAEIKNKVPEMEVECFIHGAQ